MCREWFDCQMEQIVSLEFQGVLSARLFHRPEVNLQLLSKLTYKMAVFNDFVKRVENPERC